MASKYYDPKTGYTNYRAIEKAVGYKLSEIEREYAVFYYQEGCNYGKNIEDVPDFCSETYSDFVMMLWQNL